MGLLILAGICGVREISPASSETATYQILEI